VVRAVVEAAGDARAAGPDSPLLYAARFNPEPGVIRALVERGADVTADLGFPTLARPALTYAAQSNPNPAVLDELLADGAAVNAKVSVLDNMGFTPLLYAAQCNPNPQVVRELVRKGARIELADAMDRTPLVLAAQYGENPEVLRALLALGATVNLACRDYSNVGWTPLMYAAASPASPLPKIAALLAAGADAKVRSREGRTALDYADANPEVLRGDPAYLALAEASH
jgi:ankyrin repeat protein